MNRDKHFTVISGPHDGEQKEPAMPVSCIASDPGSHGPAFGSEYAPVDGPGGDGGDGGDGDAPATGY